MTQITDGQMRELLENATEGEWEAEVRNFELFNRPYKKHGAIIPGVVKECHNDWGEHPPLTPEDAQFIVAAKKWIPQALARLAKLS